MLSLASSTIKLAASFLNNNNNNTNNHQQQQPEQLVQYSLSQVALHSSSHDCWIVIRDKVYAVTPYLTRVRSFHYKIPSYK